MNSPNNSTLIGEKEKIKQFILSIHELENYKIFLFGSRVKGDFKPNSDYDIGILGKDKLEFKILLKIKRYIENMPFLIDIVDFHRVDKEFKNLALKNIETWR